MHSTTTLHSSDFKIVVKGKESGIDQLFPGFNPFDRLGILIRSAGEGLGASALIMAFATAFYDHFRDRLGDQTGQLFIYPEIFAFHIDQLHTNHTALDVWPKHKEIVVPDNPQLILEAMNDRGITRVILPQTMPQNYGLAREEVSSALERMKTALVYAPFDQIDPTEISITSCPKVEQYVETCIEVGNALSEDQRIILKSKRKSLALEGMPVETYHRIEISKALSMLG
jgi:hypothetical protein